MDIYLCRHGQSENNLLPVAEHRPDPPLTALGQAQAEMLARPLSARRPALLLSSPLLRALETAGPLAARTGCPWEVWEDLAEAHRAHPDDGLPLPELRRRFPQVRWAPRMRWPGTPGPESEAQARDRAANLVRRLTAAARRGPLVVIGHGNLNAYLLAAWLGTPPAVRFEQDNAAIHHLVLEDGRVRVVRLNEGGHLAAAGADSFR